MFLQETIDGIKKAQNRITNLLAEYVKAQKGLNLTRETSDLDIFGQRCEKIQIFYRVLTKETTAEDYWTDDRIPLEEFNALLFGGMNSIQQFIPRVIFCGEEDVSNIETWTGDIVTRWETHAKEASEIVRARLEDINKTILDMEDKLVLHLKKEAVVFEDETVQKLIDKVKELLVKYPRHEQCGMLMGQLYSLETLLKKNVNVAVFGAILHGILTPEECAKKLSTKIDNIMNMKRSCIADIERTEPSLRLTTLLREDNVVDYMKKHNENLIRGLTALIIKNSHNLAIYEADVIRIENILTTSKPTTQEKKK
jgi:hypothetical protein